MQLSVIIFTHNPREDYLLRVIEGLKNQTLPMNLWELILLDNASKVCLSEIYDLGWHPHGRHVREEELGLTVARLRGIREAAGQLLVFVDDDTVLHPEYLAVAARIKERFPFLGSFGGQVHAYYETTPGPDVRPYLHYLLDRRLTKARWGQDDDYHRFSPCGAGMVVRRAVAEAFVEKLQSDSRRLGLGRKGTQLFAGEDSDLALCSHQLGLGNGVFPELVLDHLIPASRLQPDFFVKVARAGAFSEVILRHLNGLDYSVKPVPKTTKLKQIIKGCFASSLGRRVAAARKIGRAEAIEKIRQWESS